MSASQVLPASERLFLIVRELGAFMRRERIGASFSWLEDEEPVRAGAIAIELLMWLGRPARLGRRYPLRLDLSKEFPRALDRLLREKPIFAGVFTVHEGQVELSPELSEDICNEAAELANQEYKPTVTKFP